MMQPRFLAVAKGAAMRNSATDHERQPRVDRLGRVGYLTVILWVLLAMTACSTGGGGSSSGSRRTVSDALAEAGESDERGRGKGPTRTKTDHQNQAGASEQDDADSGAGWLGNLVIGLFSGGGDDTVSDYVPIYESYGKRDTTGSARSGYTEIPQGSGGGDGHNDPRSNLLVGFTVGYPHGEDISRLTSGSLAYSRYFKDRFRAHIGGYYGEARTGTNELVQDCITKRAEAGAEIGARNYLTAGHAAIGFYVLYGVRLGGLFWDYARPVEVDDSGRTITSDVVFVGTPFLGFGCAFVQTETFQLGINGIWGIRAGAKHTGEGFLNDMFRNSSEPAWKLELTVFF